LARNCRTSCWKISTASPREALRNLRQRLRALTGKLPVPECGSITFITGGLPLGFSVPEVPSTHLFKYSDLGIAMINGFAAEQSDRPGIGFVALVDPQTTEAHEIAAAKRLLPPRGAFIRTYYGAGANVRDVTSMMELLRYDLMIIATHCGDVGDFRWTYKFTDSEGIDRTLVVDIAVGVGRTNDANMLSVTQFIRFISLDGVDWHDPEKKRTLYVGKAILDYLEMTKSNSAPMKPVKKETVPRVVGSSALKMHDHNLIVLPRALADERTAIIINNACASWHRLASNFFVGGARAVELVVSGWLGTQSFTFARALESAPAPVRSVRCSRGRPSPSRFPADYYTSRCADHKATGSGLPACLSSNFMMTSCAHGVAARRNAFRMEEDARRHRSE
jgi:hypothetical protein